MEDIPWFYFICNDGLFSNDILCFKMRVALLLSFILPLCLFNVIVMGWYFWHRIFLFPKVVPEQMHLFCIGSLQGWSRPVYSLVSQPHQLLVTMINSRILVWWKIEMLLVSLFGHDYKLREEPLAHRTQFSHLYRQCECEWFTFNHQQTSPKIGAIVWMKEIAGTRVRIWQGLRAGSWIGQAYDL